ncbi:hypothetical protein D8M38_09030 [Kocuria sp. HSID17582]|nr:hypothetical protein D8M39_09445 [Kocuria sp. HSID17590]RUQ07129.1 hypothetical protein D8M38_09030 [Kocuria sp. HSID17582]
MRRRAQHLRETGQWLPLCGCHVVGDLVRAIRDGTQHCDVGQPEIPGRHGEFEGRVRRVRGGGPLQQAGADGGGQGFPQGGLERRDVREREQFEWRGAAVAVGGLVQRAAVAEEGGEHGGRRVPVLHSAHVRNAAHQFRLGRGTRLADRVQQCRVRAHQPRRFLQGPGELRIQ